MYGGTVSYMKTIAPANGVEVTWINEDDIYSAVRDALRPNTRVYYTDQALIPR
jgi:O-acetylhomoserine/O-acetylserine sulfhydrylase-like pyridoxal-dependent enzyme